MEKQQRILKVSLDAEIRRVALTSADFSSLQKQVGDLFSLPPSSFSLKYKDDEGDLITLGSNEEFQEALNCCQDNILRLTVNKKDEVKGGEQSGPHQGRCGRGRWGGRGGKCGWRRRFQQENGLQNLFGMMGPMIHQFAGNLLEGGNIDGILEQVLKSDFVKLEHNYTCDGCDTTISGTRYRCENCQDFDFCSKCFAEKLGTHNSEHKFKEITALAALKEALASNNINIDAFFAPGKATDTVAKKIHHAFCDRCDSKIEGIRWKCFDCEDFDFCNACYLEAAGKETIKNHQKEHAFAKIDEPQQISSFPSLLAEYQNKKREELKRNQLLQKVEQKKNEEQERVAELEKQKKAIELRMAEERKKHKELEEKLEKERKELLEKQNSLKQPKEEPKPVSLDSLAPLREEKAKEEPKSVHPFEQKLEALSSMGFLDRQRNIKLLIKHSSEILPVIQELLN